MLIVDNLSNPQWAVQSGANVNPIPADSFLFNLLSDGSLKVTNSSSQAEGGALVASKRPVPSIPGVPLPYLGLDLQVYVSSFDMPILGRLEIDLKVCLTGAPNDQTSIANVANFSSQLNLSTATLQIGNNTPNWVETGLTPTILPNAWMPVSFRYFIDIPGSKFSMLSTTWGGTKFLIPSTLQEVPFESTNWQPIAAIQLQTETMCPGGLVTAYKGITLTWSDAAF